MMPRWSRFSTLIAEVIITSLRSGFGASFYFNSLMLPPTSGMWVLDRSGRGSLRGFADEG
jgi:hypothetical protein